MSTETKQEEQVKMTLGELKKRIEGKSLLLSTPCYGGVVTAEYSKCIARTMAIGAKIGVDVAIAQISNESLVQRARNYLLDEFARSNYTHQLWIDADISWTDPFAPFILMAACGEEDPYTKKPMDIVGAVYPKKHLSAMKVFTAVKSGLCDEDPESMFKYGVDLAFNTLDEGNHLYMDRFNEVREISTGFMMYGKDVVDKMKKKYPKTLYLPDHVGTANFDGSRPIHALFDCVIDQETKRYLSEDYTFIKRARDIGFNCFVLPFISLSHTGSYTYRGSLTDLAVLSGASSGQTVHPSAPMTKKEGE